MKKTTLRKISALLLIIIGFFIFISTILYVNGTIKFNIAPEKSEIEPQSNINNTELKELLNEKIKFQIPQEKIIINDKKYYLYEIDDIKSINNMFYTKKYVNETYDCDDFALESKVYINNNLPGIPIGVLSISKNIENTQDKKQLFEFEEYELYDNNKFSHAVNIIIDSKHDIYFYDPQSKKYSDINEIPFDKINYIII